MVSGVPAVTAKALSSVYCKWAVDQVCTLCICICFFMHNMNTLTHSTRHRKVCSVLVVSFAGSKLTFNCINFVYDGVFVCFGGLF